MFLLRFFQPVAAAVALGAALLFAASQVAVARTQTSTSPDFATIDSYVEQQREAKRIPGMALAIVRDREIVHTRGYGVADSTGRAVTPQTPFIIGSLTKSFTALATMQLVEVSRLELDAPVQRYLPWFAVADSEASARITIRHLLYHSSGLPAGVGNAGMANGGRDEQSLEREVRALRSVELSQPVGATYQYSTAGYVTLGLIVQAVSGQSYESYVQTHILQPLGMRQSFTSKDEAREHGLASGHRYWFGFPVPSDLPYARGVLPAGYLIASAEDMGRYLIPHLNDGRSDRAGIVSPSGMTELLRPGIEAGGPDASYAMGWSVIQDGDVRVIGHAGGTFDFRAAMSLVPERGLGMVLLMNADAALGRGQLTGIADGVYRLLLGRDLPASESSPATLIIYGVLIAAVAVQIAGIVRTALRLRGWRSQPRQRHGRWPVVRQIVLPGLTNLTWAGVTLVLLPTVLASSLTLLMLQIPDIGYVLLASGAIAFGWAAVRTALVVRALHSGNSGHPDAQEDERPRIRSSVGTNALARS